MNSLQERIPQLIEQLCAGLINRESEARLVLLAAIAGEHSLLIGPPGTAKSMLASRLKDCFDIDTFSVRSRMPRGVSRVCYFERLLTAYSLPEEIFGPLRISQLPQDRFTRKVDGYLPSAAIAFLDEIFKANSSILNSLLTLINEKQFDNDTRRENVPLISIVGASNELPEAAPRVSLDALFDRFLVRLFISYLPDNKFDELLNIIEGGSDDKQKESPPIFLLTRHDIDTIQNAAKAVILPDMIREYIKRLRRTIQEENEKRYEYSNKDGSENQQKLNLVQVSDRRWLKIIRFLKVAAYTSGRMYVSWEDCRLIQNCIWSALDHIGQTSQTSADDDKHDLNCVENWFNRPGWFELRDSASFFQGVEQMINNASPNGTEQQLKYNYANLTIIDSLLSKAPHTGQEHYLWRVEKANWPIPVNVLGLQKANEMRKRCQEKMRRFPEETRNSLQAQPLLLSGPATGTYISDDLKIPFIEIPAGDYTFIASPQERKNGQGRVLEIPSDQQFFLSVCHVTRQQWQDIGMDPTEEWVMCAEDSDAAHRPVTGFSIEKLNEFLKKINNLLPAEWRVGIPTFQLWQRATLPPDLSNLSGDEHSLKRLGIYFDDDDQRNLDELVVFRSIHTPANQEVPIRDNLSLPPNRGGFRGLHGNVYDICHNSNNNDFVFVGQNEAKDLLLCGGSHLESIFDCSAYSSKDYESQYLRSAAIRLAATKIGG